MKYNKCKDGGFVHNCHIIVREYDKSAHIFKQLGNDSLTACLNGYAIIPMEEYAKLTGCDFNVKAIDEADKELHA
tara:strand:+ start:3062 stop:3286 length:225 start_codon:yes stop_codon:yes gene_type:complete